MCKSCCDYLIILKHAQKITCAICNSKTNVDELQIPKYLHLLAAGCGLPLASPSNKVNKFLTIDLDNVVRIDGTGKATIAMTLDGSVFGLGTNLDGELSLGHALHVPSWQSISQFAYKPMRNVKCGNRHSMFLTRDGQVFTCGSNQYGQLVRQVLHLQFCREMEHKMMLPVPYKCYQAEHAHKFVLVIRTASL